MEWITLNEVEQKLARYIGSQRTARNRVNGVRDQKVGPQDGYDTDLEGAAAELAFCKLMNVYPDLSLDGHPDSDAFIYPGGTVDVKSTRYENGRLLAVRGKRDKPAAVYALMVGTFPRYRCAGLIGARSVFMNENLRDLGHGQTYAVDQSGLQSIEEWLKDYETPGQDR